MNAEGPPEFLLEAFADPNTVRDVVRGILHTIFFMRFFQSIQAATATRDCLGIDLAYVPDSAIETLIDQRATSLARQLDAERPSGGGGRGQITVQFFEKKRRKGTWFGADDELCWERWTIKITVAEPKTESDRAKVRKATETTLRSTVFKIMTCVTGHMDHIPPITESNVNPFPYRIYIGNPPSNQQSPSSQQKAATAAAGVGAGVDAVAGGWAKKMGIYWEDFLSSDAVTKVVDIAKDIGDKVAAATKEVEKKFDVYLAQLEEEARRAEMEEVRRNEEWLLVAEESRKRNMEPAGHGGVEEKNLPKGKKHDHQQPPKKDDQYEEIL